MADDTKNRGVEAEHLALERIRRRHSGAGLDRLQAYLDSRIEGGRMGESEVIEQLIAAIQEAEARGVTRYQIAQRSGVPASTLARLVARERSLKVETAERLCEALGLKLEIRSRRRRARKAER